MQGTITIRVRYPEVDAMGYLHHSRYLQYFEMGRVELLRDVGFSYAELEQQGVFFVVTKAEIKFKAPARYDEELQLTTRVIKQTYVRYDHAYELRRGSTLLAEGTTTIASVNRAGQVIPIPDAIANAGGERMTQSGNPNPETRIPESPNPCPKPQ
jgi:acyl-CoA thioester hydrolase